VELDEAANAAGALLVSGCGSRVAVLALATDEEAVMALQAIEACAGTQPATPRESAAENVLAQGRS
jgi:acetate kinase